MNNLQCSALYSIPILETKPSTLLQYTTEYSELKNSTNSFLDSCTRSMWYQAPRSFFPVIVIPTVRLTALANPNLLLNHLDHSGTLTSDRYCQWLCNRRHLQWQTGGQTETCDNIGLLHHILVIGSNLFNMTVECLLHPRWIM